ncbi:Eukaryotic integral membrane protein (DUF1751) [Geosmithia morbida]|uniref:Eukaryotic integral membrane protein (DUF1751) n=1 Tax=Geosmithia morbida TaxID=1094350 RepID=A0A9P4YXX6_9HYPO|nr:Eukaryotic integral membrane protein (DUF1751) [Geosmithia morbida]KAF4123832.1 Eukaryotic integral membrane protein (DUF1751) [Geosmithia morbida]
MAPRINLPPVTRALLIVLIFQSVLSAAIRYRHWVSRIPSAADTTTGGSAASAANDVVFIPYLTLVPQLSIVYPWTFLTTTLVESNIFTLGIAGATLFYGGRYLERAWSSRELAKFMGIVALIPNVLTFFVLFILFALSRNETWTLTVISGTVPVQISFLVAFGQLIPAHTVTLFRGLISLRVVRFPLVYVGIVAVLSLTPLLSSAATLLAFTGFLTSWTYLRFYKTVFPDLDASQAPPLRGDASETFAMAEFFPASARPFVAAVSDQVFDVLVSARLCTPFSPADVSAARGDAASSFLQRGTPGTARAEAERRRAIALRALDQRLNSASSTTTAAAAAAAAAAGTGPSAPARTSASTASETKTQTATTSKPGEMLGETKFEPDDHDDHVAGRS